MQFRIKPCYDKELIKALHKKYLPGDVLYSSPSADWVVTYQGQPIGFCQLGDDGREDAAFLARAAVDPVFKGMGLGRRLIRVRERYARAAGLLRLYTYTTVDNMQSIANLQRLGYTLYRPEVLYVGPKYLYWQKLLEVK